MKPCLILPIVMLMIANTGYSQLYNASICVNKNGILTDGSLGWANRGSYLGSNNGIFQHYGLSSGSFVNNGSFVATTGHTDNFMGPNGASGPQEIAGSVAPTFFNLTLSNNGNLNITNAGGAKVTNTLAFNTGALITTVRSSRQLGALSFANGASYTGGNANNQHVDGYVTKEGNSPFTFPIGSSTEIRTLSISAPTASTESYCAAWVQGNVNSPSSVTSPISSVSSLGYWDWIAISGTGAGITVTVSIPDLSSSGVTAPDLRLAGWNGTSWIDLSGSPNATGVTAGSSLSGTLQGNITSLAIGIVGNPLPVTLHSFGAEKSGCSARIYWVTSTEKNSAYFKVERSTDGRRFDSIGSLPSAGNSEALNSYSFLDLHPVNKINYYRVTMVDRDGKYMRSPIRDLNFDNCNNAKILVYPTLSRGTVYIDLPSGQNQASISVYTLSGSILKRPVTYHGTLGVLDLSNLAPGIYLIRIADNEGVQTFKITYQP